ncbi:MAG: LysM peptidoglycan-binding domain-containing protein, partial [Desulfarculus sp.]|nr:LysM peptidoglycan-binding domain-containing protein [Desulfarculus sp.]
GKASFELAYAQMPVLKRKARVGSVTVQVHRGDTLGRIAKIHGVSLNDLMAINPNLDPRRLRIGQSVVVPPGSGYGSMQVAQDAYPRTHRSLATSPRGSRKIHHTVKSGDTLWHIARSYNINWRDILRWNGRNSSRLQVGQDLVLYVPSAKAEGKVDTQPTQSGDLIHVVKRGDNLWTIGRRYGVTPNQLKRWNNLRSSAIAPGDKLTVKR